MSRDAATAVAWVLGPPVAVLYVLVVASLVRALGEAAASGSWEEVAVFGLLGWLVAGTLVLCVLGWLQ